MPYTISWSDDMFVAKFEGIISGDEIEAVNNLFCGDERMESIRRSLWDFSSASIIHMPVHEIENAAAFDKATSKTNRHLKGALVSGGPQVHEKLEQYLRIARELDVDWDTRLFLDLESARNWLAPNGRTRTTNPLQAVTEGSPKPTE